MIKIGFVAVQRNRSTTVDEWNENGCNSKDENGNRCGSKRGFIMRSGPPGFQCIQCSNCGIETTIYNTKEMIDEVEGKGNGPQDDGSFVMSLKY